MKKTCLLALMVLVSAASVSAADDKDNDGTAATSDQKDQKKDKPKEKMICRTENATGSLTNVRRTCMTQAQWNAVAQQTRKDVNDTIDYATRPQPVQNNMPGPGGQ